MEEIISAALVHVFGTSGYYILILGLFTLVIFLREEKKDSRWSKLKLIDSICYILVLGLIVLYFGEFLSYMLYLPYGFFYQITPEEYPVLKPPVILKLLVFLGIFYHFISGRLEYKQELFTNKKFFENLLHKYFLSFIVFIFFIFLLTAKPIISLRGYYEVYLLNLYLSIITLGILNCLLLLLLASIPYLCDLKSSVTLSPKKILSKFLKSALNYISKPEKGVKITILVLLLLIASPVVSWFIFPSIKETPEEIRSITIKGKIEAPDEVNVYVVNHTRKEIIVKPGLIKWISLEPESHLLKYSSGNNKIKEESIKGKNINRTIYRFGGVKESFDITVDRDSEDYDIGGLFDIAYEMREDKISGINLTIDTRAINFDFRRLFGKRDLILRLPPGHYMKDEDCSEGNLCSIIPDDKDPRVVKLDLRLTDKKRYEFNNIPVYSDI